MAKLSRAALVLSVVLPCASCDEPTPVATSGSAPVSAKTSAKPGASGATTTPAVSGSAPATSATVVVPPEPPPACKKSNEKVQAENAYAVTGLTTKGFKKELAIGFAAGAPKVLVIDSTGATRVLDVARGEKTKLDKDSGTWRNLMRVSPREISGTTARAFIDYSDHAKDKTDKTRHIWCGPADATETFLDWHGTSWLDLDPKPTGEDKKKLFSWKKLGGYIELRDCRTFVTLETDRAWALGSVLRGIEKEDGTNEWKTVLVVDYGKNDDEVVLYENPLKGDPPKLGTFEIPTMRRVGDLGYIVAARLGGALWVARLDKDRRLKGTPKFYLGWPSGPDIGTTEENLYLITGVGLGKDKMLKGLIIPRDTLALPEKYTDISLQPMDGSGDPETQFFAPELTMDAKGGLWLVYVEGTKDKGHLRIVPVGTDMQPKGRSFPITSGDTYVSEARLHPLDDGRFTVAYLRTVGKKTDLVTEELACDVLK